jgi:hypothetical protein
MAEDTTPPPIPLGAQIMRKMHASLKAAMDIVTPGHGMLDECEAKNTIAEHMKAIGNCMGGMSKAFAKYYKGIELEEAPVENPNDSEAYDEQQDGDPETMTAEELKAWEESKHPRADDGKFGEGGGGGSDEIEEITPNYEDEDTSGSEPTTIRHGPSESLNKVPDKYRDQGAGNADYLANKRRKNIKNTDDDMDPTEKAMIATRIKMLESKIRHAERLQRVARSRR